MVVNPQIYRVLCLGEQSRLESANFLFMFAFLPSRGRHNKKGMNNFLENKSFIYNYIINGS